jgi:dihydroflavonol-4-reductase
VEFYRQGLMRALVTGATGFIGGNIAQKLCERGYDVNVLIREHSDKCNIEKLPVKIFYGDLCNSDSLNEALKGCNALFHTAALYSFWERNPEIFYEINVEGTKKIINAAMQSGVEKIIYTSSESAIKLEGSKNTETHPGIHKLKPLYQLNNINEVAGDYKKSKILAEIEVLKMIDKKWPIVIINPTTPIGAKDVKPTPTGRIVLDYINRKMPAYVNTGLNIVDVEDVALAHVAAFEKASPGSRYLIGNKNLTLKQIFLILEQITNVKAPAFEIPLNVVKVLSYVDEFISGKVLKKCPKIPLAAVKTACKYRFFNCGIDAEELGIKLTAPELSFEKAVRWFKDNGYARN